MGSAAVLRRAGARTLWGLIGSVPPAFRMHDLGEGFRILPAPGLPMPDRPGEQEKEGVRDTHCSLRVREVTTGSLGWVGSEGASSRGAVTRPGRRHVWGIGFPVSAPDGDLA